MRKKTPGHSSRDRTPSPHRWLAEIRRLAEAGDAAAQNELGAAFAGAVPGIGLDAVAAEKWLRKAAAQGLPEARINLGRLLLKNGDGPKDEAIVLLREAVAQGHPLAMAHLAWAHWTGTGVDKDLARAEALYRQAVELGLPDAMTALAGLYELEEELRNPEEALRLNRRAAELGHPAGWFGVGIAFLEGTGGERQDDAEAVACFRRATEIGFAPAMRAMGICCERGRGVPRDLKEARRWYERSAQGGDPEGARLLARMVYDGIGTEGNIVKGIDLYRQAAAQGDEPAQLMVAASAECGLGMAHDEAFALKAYRRIADSGSNVQAMYALGMVYENGLLGAAADRTEADRWFRRAADHGHVGAATALNFPHKPLNFRPDRLTRTEKAWIVGARRGDPAAMRDVGARFVYGWSNTTAADACPEEGLRWLTAAVRQKDAEAAVLLPACLEQIRGATGHEWAETRRQLLRLAEEGHVPALEALARLHECWRGQPFRKPMLEVVKWRRQAAERTNDPEIANNLGINYFNLGQKGESQRPWLNETNSGLLRKLVDRVLRTLIGGFLHRKQRDGFFKESRNWHQKAADKNCANAFTNLGDLCFTGQGEARDDAKAFGLYRQAATLGDAAAKLNLGVMLLKGWGCEKDEARGRDILLDAKKKGVAQAGLACFCFDLPDAKAGEAADLFATLKQASVESPSFVVQRAVREMFKRKAQTR